MTTREREFGLASAEFSIGDDPMTRRRRRIPDIDEVGEVEFRPNEPLQPCLPGN